MSKKLIKDIKSWMTISLVFIISVTLFWITYAAISQVNNWDTLTSAKWNEIVNLINWHNTSINSLSWTISWLSSAPAWMISAFYLTSCPTWWKAADGTNSTPDLRWQFIRWINNFWSAAWTRSDGKQDPDWLRSVWSYQADEYKSHTHNYTSASWPWSWVNTASPTAAWKTDLVSSAAWWNESRWKNVWVIFCVKN